jgi:hypothetical protein
MGTLVGDVGSATLGPFTGFADQWFHVRVNETRGLCQATSFTVNLQAPAGIAYQLTIYASNTATTCPPVPPQYGQVNNGPGGLNQWTLFLCPTQCFDPFFGWYDCANGDDNFDAWILVRWMSGSACGSWSLTASGNTAPYVCGSSQCP